MGVTSRKRLTAPIVADDCPHDLNSFAAAIVCSRMTQAKSDDADEKEGR
jgi:hypothetical protein